MIIVVNDANILIDLVKLRMLPHFFALGFTFCTTDLVLFEQELAPYIDQGNLDVIEITNEQFLEIIQITSAVPTLSEQDCSAFYQARELNAMLLTSDNKLRKFAKESDLQVHGHLWVFDSDSQQKNATSVKSNGRRKYKITAMREVSVKTVPARANISKAKNGVNHKTTNQSLSINIIPFKHPVVERAFSFSKEKKDGYYPIHRAELPKSIWEEYEDDLQDIKYLYSNFQDEENADFSASVNFKSSSRFAKHYYTTLIHEYFSTRADAIKKNYVGDIQLWFKNESLSNEKINAYEKYTIKVEFSSLCHAHL